MKSITADTISFNQSTKEVTTSISLRAAKPCQVHMVLDDAGNITTLDCTSVSCTKTCNLYQKDKGGGVIEY
jgi:hypothetical protein